MHLSAADSNGRCKAILSLLLFVWVVISGCAQTRKNVTPQLVLPLAASAYVPQDLALEYASHFFDVNENGILLKKPNGLTLNLLKKQQRFPFAETNLYMQVDVDNAGRVIWANGAWIFVTTKYFSKPEDAFAGTFMTKIGLDWHALVFIHEFKLQQQAAERSEQKIRKICTALNSLGVHVE